MRDQMFTELLESVREGGAILRGEQEASRRFEIEPPDMPHDPYLAPTFTPPYPFKWTRRLVVLLACLFLSLLAGGVTGVVVNRIDSAGYFVSWRRLPDPPAAATSLALGVTGRDEFNQMFTLYARLASGDSVALPLREAVWQPVA